MLHVCNSSFQSGTQRLHEEVDEHAHARRHMTLIAEDHVDVLDVARVVVGQEFDEASRREIVLDMKEAQTADAETFERHLAHRRAVVREDVAAHGKVKHAPVDAKRPFVHRAAKVEVETAMAREIFGRLRYAVRFEITRRGHHRASRRPELARMKIRIRQRPRAHGHVDAFALQIHHRVRQREIDANAGIARGKQRHQRHDVMRAHRNRHVDAQRAVRRRDALGDAVLGFVDVVENAHAAVVEQPPFVGHREMPRGALKQQHAEPFFEAADHLADRRRRELQRLARRRKTAGFDHAREHPHFAASTVHVNV
ncbi:hypothetical protein PT2222_80223 [Paraburkholderia tropica]